MPHVPSSNARQDRELRVARRYRPADAPALNLAILEAQLRTLADTVTQEARKGVRVLNMNCPLESLFYFKLRKRDLIPPILNLPLYGEGTCVAPNCPCRDLPRV